MVRKNNSNTKNKIYASASTKIALFQGKEIRKVLHENEWYFSIVDIIAVLTDSENPRDYWYRMKQREKDSSRIELSTKCRQLKLASSDGKSYSTEVANTENAFRIIQSMFRNRNGIAGKKIK